MSNYTRSFSAPPTAVVQNGKFNFGCYNAAIRHVNLLDATRPLGLPLPRFLKNIQLREWQAFQIGNAEHFAMIAIYNTKKLSLVQFIYYDILNNKKYRYEKKVPAWTMQIAQGLHNSTSNYTSKDFTLTVHNNLDEETIKISVAIQNFGELPDVKANFVGHHCVGEVAPMVVCMPFSSNRGMYSHKCLMPLEGELSIDNQAISFSKNSSHMVVDDHKGYYPFPTKYDWATGFTYTPEGVLMGFNFTRNQVLHPKKYNENALWYGNELHPLPPVQFERPSGVQNTWFISDEYGMVNLRFTPVINTSVHMNLLIFASRYEGPYGFFEGYISKSDGTIVPIDRVFGMGEDFYLRA